MWFIFEAHLARVQDAVGIEAGLRGDEDRHRLAMLARLSAGCSSSSSAQPKAPAPVEVGVAEVICKQIDDSDDFTGRLEAVHAQAALSEGRRLVRQRRNIE